MKTRPKNVLLVAGLVALAASLIGPAVQASITGDLGWRNGHMGSSGHMGWRGNERASDDVIEGAPDTDVTATEFSFSPAELTVTAGEPVNITLANTGEVPHDLVIPDLGVRLATGPGREATTGFEVEEAGTYGFLCTYPGHADAGMTGILTVMPNT